MFQSTKPKPKCVQCEVVESLLWRPLENGHICYNCFEENANNQPKTEAEPKATDEVHPAGGSVEDRLQRVRKSTRSTRYKSKAGAASGAVHSTGSTTAAANGGNASGTAVAGNGNGATGGGGGSKTAPKGRNRRNLFKKVPTKTPTVTATTTCVESLFYNVGYLDLM